MDPQSQLDAFDYNWYKNFDQAKVVNDLGKRDYLMLGLILFVWELLLTMLLLGFFLVHGSQDLSTLSRQVYIWFLLLLLLLSWPL